MDPASPATNGVNGNGETVLEATHATKQVSSIMTERLRRLDLHEEEHGSADKSAGGRRLALIIAGCVALAALAFAGFWVFEKSSFFGSDYTATNDTGETIKVDGKGLQFLPVGRADVIFTITEKGELEAVQNTEIVCKVRSSGRGSSDATTIKKLLVEDGQQVAAGTVLVELDASGFAEQLQTQQIQVRSAKLAWDTAQDEKTIVESQNKKDIAAAEDAVKIAKLDLLKYEEGDLYKQRNKLLGDIKLAESDLLRLKRRFVLSEKLLRKGIVADTQVQEDEAAYEKANITVLDLKRQLEALDKYESERNRIDWRSKVSQAETNLKTVKLQATSKETQAEATVKAKEAIYQTEVDKEKDLKEDIENCTIKAPREGMVVFFIDERSSYGFSGSSSRMVADNEKVGNGQRLMRIPDLRHMQVKVKVHESLEPRLREALQARRGSGLPANIKLASRDQPLNLQGHVRSVAAAASSMDRYSSDVRVYPATVAIEQTFEPEGFYIKPGTSAEVMVFLDERKNVLRLPVQAVLAVHDERFCYVKNDNKIEKRVIQTGLNNTKYVEVVSGLEEGDEVLHNPRPVAEKLGHLHSKSTKELAAADFKRPEGKPGEPPMPPNGAPIPPGDVQRPPVEPGKEPRPNTGRPPGGGGTPEEREKRAKERVEAFRKATPAERKAMLEQMPEGFRDRVKQQLKDKGIEIPD